MNRFLKLVGLALLVAFAFSAAAMAQGIPTGRLSGRVTDSEGNGVPGVAVEIQSQSLQGLRTASPRCCSRASSADRSAKRATSAKPGPTA